MDLLRVNGFLVPLIGGLVKKLAVSEPVKDKHHLLDLDPASIVHSFGPILNQGTPWNGEFLLDGGQIIFDDPVHLFPAAENLLILCNPPQSLFVFLLQGQDFQAD